MHLDVLRWARKREARRGRKRQLSAVQIIMLDDALDGLLRQCPLR